MRSHLHRILFLLLAATSHRISTAAEKSCNNTLDALANFNRALAATEAKLADHFHEASNLRFETSIDPKLNYPHFVNIYVVSPSGERSLSATSTFAYRIKSGAVGFNITVLPITLRRLGLSEVAKAYVLTRHPEITRIDDTLLESNAAGFSSFVAGRRHDPEFGYAATREEMGALLARASDPSEHAQLRAEILRGYREFTAAGLVNEKFGFRNVRSILVEQNFDTLELTYATDFGEADDGTTKISLILGEQKFDLK